MTTSLMLVRGDWDADDFDVRDENGRVVGRIMAPASAQRSAVVLDNVEGIKPSLSNRGYAATREQAMSAFKARWNEGP